MRIVAEGVESDGVCQALRALGVDVIQGYYVARPMPSSDVPDWVRRWTALRFPRVSGQDQREGAVQR
jgi:EAL domain-containing protein (putative c-di-GMP-specific phosphodiesterase class I)